MSVTSSVISMVMVFDTSSNANSSEYHTGNYLFRSGTSSAFARSEKRNHSTLKNLFPKKIAGKLNSDLVLYPYKDTRVTLSLQKHSTAVLLKSKRNLQHASAPLGLAQNEILFHEPKKYGSCPAFLATSFSAAELLTYFFNWVSLNALITITAKRIPAFYRFEEMSRFVRKKQVEQSLMNHCQGILSLFLNDISMCQLHALWNDVDKILRKPYRIERALDYRM